MTAILVSAARPTSAIRVVAGRYVVGWSDGYRDFRPVVAFDRPREAIEAAKALETTRPEPETP